MPAFVVVHRSKIAEVIQQCGAKPALLFVLIGTFTEGRRNDAGWCIPTRELGELMNCSPRQVRRYTLALEEAGFLEISEQWYQRPNEAGKHRGHSRYELGEGRGVGTALSVPPGQGCPEGTDTGVPRGRDSAVPDRRTSVSENGLSGLPSPHTPEPRDLLEWAPNWLTREWQAREAAAAGRRRLVERPLSLDEAERIWREFPPGEKTERIRIQAQDLAPEYDPVTFRKVPLDHWLSLSENLQEALDMAVMALCLEFAERTEEPGPPPEPLRVDAVLINKAHGDAARLGFVGDMGQRGRRAVAEALRDAMDIVKNRQSACGKVTEGA